MLAATMRSATTHWFIRAALTVAVPAALGLAGAPTANAAAPDVSVLASPFAVTSSVRGTAADTSWYHDPVSAAARAKEMPVPGDPATWAGPTTHTVATYRAAAGEVAIPVGWASGHELHRSEAVVLNNAGLFGFNSPTPTAGARAEVTRLVSSLKLARGVRCEGYADFGGVAAHEQRLSEQRASAICALIAARMPSIVTASVGYGGNRPVVVGGSQADRAANRRVIVEVTASVGPPSAPRALSVVAGIDGATLTFTAPARDGGSPVTGYEYSLDGGAHWIKLATTGSGPLHATLADLGDGHSYTVVVRARNAAGASGPSPSASFTPQAAQPASGVSGNANAGTSSGTSSTTTTTEATTTASSSTTTATTSTTTTTTPPTTSSTTSSSTSTSSTTTTTATTTTTPDAPEILEGSPFPEFGGKLEWAVTLRFNPPSSDGGDPIVGYRVSVNEAPYEPLSYSEGSPLEATLYGFGNWCYPLSTTKFAIEAVNEIGDSLPSNTVEVSHEEEGC